MHSIHSTYNQFTQLDIVRKQEAYWVNVLLKGTTAVAEPTILELLLYSGWNSQACGNLNEHSVTNNPLINEPNHSEPRVYIPTVWKNQAVTLSFCAL